MLFQCRQSIKSTTTIPNGIMGNESLDASQIGIPFNRSRHRRSKSMKADRLHHAQGMKHKGLGLYAGKIHRISQMLLYNREDLVNFNQVLGIRNLHRKKRLNFSTVQVEMIF